MPTIEKAAFGFHSSPARRLASERATIVVWLEMKRAVKPESVSMVSRCIVQPRMSSPTHHWPLLLRSEMSKTPKPESSSVSTTMQVAHTVTIANGKQRTEPAATRWPIIVPMMYST